MPRTAFLALLALLLSLCTTKASVPQEEYEVENAHIEGTWRVTVWKEAGKEHAPAGDLDNYLFVITRDQVVLRKRGQKTSPDHAYYRLDPRRSPPAIDFFGVKPPGAGLASRGIYRLSGNRLTLCWDMGTSRPRAFISKPGTKTYLFEMVREK